MALSDMIYVQQDKKSFTMIKC